MDFGELEEPAGTMCKAEPQQSISRATARRLAVVPRKWRRKDKIGGGEWVGDKMPPTAPQAASCILVNVFCNKTLLEGGRAA